MEGTVNQITRYTPVSTINLKLLAKSDLRIVLAELFYVCLDEVLVLQVSHADFIASLLHVGSTLDRLLLQQKLNLTDRLCLLLYHGSQTNMDILAGAIWPTFCDAIKSTSTLHHLIQQIRLVKSLNIEWTINPYTAHHIRCDIW